jgi:hypothetical protein
MGVETLMRIARPALVLSLPVLLAAAMVVGGCAGQAPSSDGAGLLVAKCSGCHPADRAQAEKRDRAAWTATIDRMIGHGASLTDQEKATLIDYLSQRDAAK